MIKRTAPASNKMQVLQALNEAERQLLLYHNGFVEVTDEGVDASHKHVQTTISFCDDLRNLIQRVGKVEV